MFCRVLVPCCETMLPSSFCVSPDAACECAFIARPCEEVGFGVGDGLWSSLSLSSPLLCSAPSCGDRHRERVRIGERTNPFQRCGLYGVSRVGFRSVAGILLNTS